MFHGKQGGIGLGINAPSLTDRCAISNPKSPATWIPKPGIRDTSSTGAAATATVAALEETQRGLSRHPMVW
jgi:hypothetical protein